MPEHDDVLRRLEQLEKANGQLSELVSHLKNAAIVTASIQDRQANSIEDQREHLEALDRSVNHVVAGVSKLSGVASHLVDHAEESDARRLRLETTMEESNARLSRVEKILEESTVRQARLEITVQEIGDKLNGLIGYLEGRHNPPE